MAIKILLVDDEPDLLALVSHGLKKRGYEVSGGRDGGEALALAPELMPDIMIIDVHLPVMNGDEIVRIFKKDEKLKNIPIFLISSGSEGLDGICAACGADAYLNKPFELEELVDLIKKHYKPSAAGT